MSVNPRMNIRDLDSEEGKRALRNQMKRATGDQRKLMQSREREKQLIKRRKLEPIIGR